MRRLRGDVDRRDQQWWDAGGTRRGRQQNHEIQERHETRQKAAATATTPAARCPHGWKASGTRGGEVGLIFAQMGLAAGVLNAGLFSALALMVMVTTFMAPPLLKLLLPPIGPKGERRRQEGIEDLVTEVKGGCYAEAQSTSLKP